MRKTKQGDTEIMRIKVYSSVDTLQFNSYQTPAAENIKGLHTDAKYNTKTGLYRYIINPNTHIDIAVIDTKDQSITSCIDILAQADIDEYIISRIDIAFNMYEALAFTDYAKINGLLLQLISKQYTCSSNDNDNLFFVYDRFDKLRSIKIINQYFDIEVYDKKAEEPNGDITNRLEIRLKKINAKSIDQGFNIAYKRMLNILEKSVTKENYNAVLSDCNMILFEELAKQPEETRHKTIEKILFEKRNKAIYNTEQLTEFFEAIEKHDPKRKAQNFMRENDVERISFSRLQAYVNELKKAVKNYFKNTAKSVCFNKKISA